MAADPNKITVRIVLANRKAVRDFLRAVELLSEAVEDQPWQTGLQQSLKLLRRCRRGLRPVNKKR